MNYYDSYLHGDYIVLSGGRASNNNNTVPSQDIREFFKLMFVRSKYDIIELINCLKFHRYFESR